MWRATLKQAGEKLPKNEQADLGGQVTYFNPFRGPVQAIIDATGERVTLLGPCDWENHSAGNYGVDRRGKQIITTQEEVTITDPQIPNEHAMKPEQPSR